MSELNKLIHLTPMEVPTKEQVFAKYVKLLEKKGYFKDVPEDQMELKKNKAKQYFDEHYGDLKRFPAVKIPKTPQDVNEEKKKEAEQHKVKGNELFAQKDYSTAICEYSRAIECDPFNHIYYSNRSACYCYVNNDELAVRDGEKCVELCPNFAKGYSRLSAALLKMGKLQEAKEAIDKALSIDPENQVYLNSKMDILEELSKIGVKEEKPKEKVEEKKKPQQPNPQPNQQGGGFASLLNNLMSNPSIQQMAQSMMSNPAMMNMAQNMMNNPAMMNMAQNMMGGQGGLGDLLNNPELRQMAEQMAGSQSGQQGNNEQKEENEEI